MDDDGWDLQAVVRGFLLSSSPANSSAVEPYATLSTALINDEPAALGDASLSFPELSTCQSSLQELDELCDAFISESKPRWSSQTPLPPPPVPPPVQPQLQPKQPQRSVSQMSRSKRRKNKQKRVVCHVPADGLVADVWAWRKYGQKPIKGSPYPRGYYKCSSSKGCLARKQVERSRADPGMFIITYTAEHNHPAPTHRNSLAGSTRTKFPSSATSAAAGNTKEQQKQSPMLAAGLSPNTPLTSSMEEEDEDEQGVLMVEDIEVMGEDDLLFMGIDEITGGSSDGGAAVGSELFDGSDDRLYSVTMDGQ